MSASGGRRRDLASRIGVVGAALGVAAGVVQVTAGTEIPEWSGAKAAPVALGVLTIVLSLLAGLGATLQRSPGRTVGLQAAAAAGMLMVGLLCFTTVGRLWYPPGVLLILASALTVASPARTARVIAENWLRCLLTALGLAELLMIAGAEPHLVLVGALGGVALVAAAWLRSAHQALLVGLVAAGTLPLAILAWSAVVPVLLLGAAVAIATPLVLHARRCAAELRALRSDPADGPAERPAGIAA